MNAIAGFEEMWQPVVEAYTPHFHFQRGVHLLRVGDKAKRRAAKEELLEWIDSMGTVRERHENRHIKEVVKLFKTTWDDIHIEDDKVWCDAFRGGLEQRCRQLDPETHRVKRKEPYSNAERTKYPAPNIAKAITYQNREIRKFCNRLCTLSIDTCRTNHLSAHTTPRPHLTHRLWDSDARER